MPASPRARIKLGVPVREHATGDLFANESDMCDQRSEWKALCQTTRLETPFWRTGSLSPLLQKRAWGGCPRIIEGERRYRWAACDGLPMT
jgi:hypothetical protein